MARYSGHVIRRIDGVSTFRCSTTGGQKTPGFDWLAKGFSQYDSLLAFVQDLELAGIENIRIYPRALWVSWEKNDAVAVRDKKKQDM